MAALGVNFFKIWLAERGRGDILDNGSSHYGVMHIEMLSKLSHVLFTIAHFKIPKRTLGS